MKSITVNQHLQKPVSIHERLHRLAQNLYAEARARGPGYESILIGIIVGYSASIEKLANELEDLTKRKKV